MSGESEWFLFYRISPAIYENPGLIMTRLDKCEHEIRHVRLLRKFKMADYLESLAASDRNCGDHSLVNKYSSYDILRHYKLMLKTLPQLSIASSPLFEQASLISIFSILINYI
jgi:hypothetical protein